MSSSSTATIRGGAGASSLSWGMTSPLTGPTPTSPACTTASASTCDFDLAACARDCSVVLEETGNCAASVYAYSCGCGADCSGTAFYPNTSVGILNVGAGVGGASGGLPAGLVTCANHYSTLQYVIYGAVGGYIFFAAIAVWLHFRASAALLAAKAACARLGGDGLEEVGGDGDASPAAARGGTRGRSRSKDGAGRGVGGPGEGTGTEGTWRESVGRTLRDLAGLSPPAASGYAPVERVPLLPQQDGGAQRPQPSAKGRVALAPVPVWGGGGQAAGPGAGYSPPSLDARRRPSSAADAEAALAIVSSPTARRAFSAAEGGSSSEVSPVKGMGPGGGGGATTSSSSFAPAAPRARSSSASAASARRDAGSSSSSFSNPAGGVGGVGNKKQRRQMQAFAAAAAARRSARAVSHVAYAVLCQSAVLLGSFLWSFFLVSQGRYCTGIDGDTSGEGTPFVGDAVLPSRSLILRFVPGCAFGASWQDADYEGAVLSSVYLFLVCQAVALGLLGLDQGVHLLQACLHRCNAVGGAGKGAGGATGGRGNGASSSSSSSSRRRCCVWLASSSSSSSSSSRGFDTTKVWVPEAWVRDWPAPRVVDCCPRRVPVPGDGTGRGAGMGVLPSVAAGEEDVRSTAVVVRTPCVVLRFGAPPR
jgi:hypothetical protein